MASNDSGVDTSNDSYSTNDNSNSNSNNTSLNVSAENRLVAFVPELQSTTVRLMASLSSIGGDIDNYKPPTTHAHVNKITSRVNRCTNSNSPAGRRNQHNQSTRNALIPYVCSIPNERKLRMAASVSNTELLLRMLQAGVDPNAADEHLRSPLHLAASRGYKDVVKFLLSHGANPNRQDSLGNTPLHLAVCSASSYNFNMVKSVLRIINYIKYRMNLYLSNFILQVVRILLQNGARVNILDKTGKTPLDLAKSKLLLMRTRLGMGSTPESAKLFVEMSMLTGLLHKTLTQQLKDVEQFDELEARLRSLTTKEIEDGADNLLMDVAGLKIN